jgi:hypothetical protein
MAKEGDIAIREQPAQNTNVVVALQTAAATQRVFKRNSNG